MTGLVNALATGLWQIMEFNRIYACHQKLSDQGKTIIPLHSGNPADFGHRFPVNILKSIYEVAYLSQALQYQPDAQGLLCARLAVANYYHQQGYASIIPENIIISAGTSESFRLILDSLAQPGDNILLASPGYPLFGEIADLNHINIKYYTLNYDDHEFNFDFNQLEDLIDDKTRAVIVVSPHNPSGMVIHLNVWDKLVSLCALKKIALIADEVFSEFCFNQSTLPRMLDHPDLYLGIVLNGISKMFALPSFKLGWMVFQGKQSAQLIGRIAHINDNFLSCHQAIAQGLEKLFATGEEFVRNYRSNIIANYQYIKSLLKDSPHLKLYEASGGFYVLIKILHPNWQDEEDLVCALLNKGYFCHPGYFYDIEDGCHLVISLLGGQEILMQFYLTLTQILTSDRSLFLDALP